MTLPKNASPEARSLHNEANRHSKQRLAKRIENKRLYEHDLVDPAYYNDIERQLRQQLPEFEIDVAPDRTIILWRGPDGNRVGVRDDTRPGALLKVWRGEDVPTEF